jgi:hypothetical protein
MLIIFVFPLFVLQVGSLLVLDSGSDVDDKAISLPKKLWLNSLDKFGAPADCNFEECSDDDAFSENSEESDDELFDWDEDEVVVEESDLDDDENEQVTVPDLFPVSRAAREEKVIDGDSDDDDTPLYNVKEKTKNLKHLQNADREIVFNNEGDREPEPQSEAVRFFMKMKQDSLSFSFSVFFETNCTCLFFASLSKS